MPAFGKKTVSEDEASDDMGSNKQTITQKKQNVKKKKRINTKEEEEEENNTDGASVVLPISSPTNSQEPERKKLKKEKKQPKQKATPKKKAPLDLDRQCGVLIEPNNHPCTRSLTCKIHSMGAKRSVEGRTQPFNILLAAYQKKSIGRPQVPAGITATNETEGTTKTKTSGLDKSKKTMSDNSIVTNYVTTLNKEEEHHDVDSEEETESVRLAIEQNKPIPLGTKRLFYVRRKRKYYKLRDILLEAITPKHTNTTTSAKPATTISTELHL